VGDPVPSTRPAEVYRGRQQRFEAERRRLDQRSLWLSRVRLLLAGCAVGALAWLAHGGGPFGIAACGAAVIALGGVVLWHARVDARAQQAARLAELNADALARLARAWAEVRDWLPPVPPDPAHPYAADLDVTGHASLLRLLGRARTRAGDRRLTDWLLTPAGPGVIARRQGVVAALAPRVDDRQRLALHALATLQMSELEAERFLHWCEGDAWLRRRPWLYGAFVVLAVLAGGSILANLQGWLQGWWLSAVAANLALSAAVQRRLTTTFEDASWQAALRGWRAMLDVLASMRDATPRLGDLDGGSTPIDGAGRALDALDRILGFASLRHTPLFHWPIHLLTSWDAHVRWALDGWRQRYGGQVRRWIEAASTAEALAALAGLAHDHPAWTFPRVDAGAASIETVGMGHPLLPPERCVANSLSVGPAGTTVLVTGSNMSGKSTLLRAIGANAVLAQAGAPVCAASWHMPPVQTVTSMRIADSLEDGVSYFMASLARLGLVVKAANDATARAGSPLVLYLLDELLSGTNTAERAAAVRAVVAHLLDCRAVGALTTHDLGLAEAPELQTHATLVHFAESVAREGGQVHMTFDYRLRPGVATSTNALVLMEVVGLRAALEEGGGPRSQVPGEGQARAPVGPGR
jgi:hypothetical protein